MTDPQTIRKPPPPLSVDAEAAILGAALMNPAAIDVIIPWVNAEEFSSGPYSFIWGEMLAMHKAGEKIDLIRVTRRVSDPVFAEMLAQDNNGLTIPALMAALVGTASTVINAPDHARDVRDTYHRRNLIDAAEILLRDAANPSVPLRDVCSATSGVIERALNFIEPPKRGMSELLRRAEEALDPDRVSTGITTGLRDIDAVLGGFIPGDLIIAGARPSMGKSAFACSTCLGSARASRKIKLQGGDVEPWGVLFLSHEMTHDQVVHRWLTDIAFDRGDPRNPIEYQRFRPAPLVKPEPLSQQQRIAFNDAKTVLGDLPLAIDGRPGMTISEVSALVRRHMKSFAARGTPLKVIAFDHIGLGKILPDPRPGRQQNRVDEVGEITTGIKALAVNEGFAALALHQLSRANEGRENKRPGLSDFRDSGHIEQDADSMIGLYRDSYYLERTRESDQSKETARIASLQQAKHDLEVLVLKNRNGPITSKTLWVNMGANALRNDAPSHMEAR